MLFFIIKGLIQENYNLNDVVFTFGLAVEVFFMSVFNLVLCFIIWRRKNKYKVTLPEDEVDLKNNSVKGTSITRIYNENFLFELKGFR